MQRLRHIVDWIEFNTDDMKAEFMICKRACRALTARLNDMCHVKRTRQRGYELKLVRRHVTPQAREALKGAELLWVSVGAGVELEVPAIVEPALDR